MRKVSVLFLCLFLGVVCLTTSSWKFDDDTTYEVYTFYDDASYYSYEDGYYYKGEYKDSDFATVQKKMSKYRKDWTKSEITNYLITKAGFDTENAAEAESWLFSVDHGGIASRNGSYVYFIIK